jgi:hypothetical protein
MDERSNARLLLDAYELIGEVIKRHLAVASKADERERNARDDKARENAQRAADAQDEMSRPLETAQVALLKALTRELNEPRGRLEFIEYE